MFLSTYFMYQLTLRLVPGKYWHLVAFSAIWTKGSVELGFSPSGYSSKTETIWNTMRYPSWYFQLKESHNLYLLPNWTEYDYIDIFSIVLEAPDIGVKLLIPLRFLILLVWEMYKVLAFAVYRVATIAKLASTYLLNHQQCWSDHRLQHYCDYLQVTLYYIDCNYLQ